MIVALGCVNNVVVYRLLSPLLWLCLWVYWFGVGWYLRVFVHLRDGVCCLALGFVVVYCLCFVRFAWFG